MSLAELPLKPEQLDAFSIDVLKILRGRRTSSAMSQMLGFSYNKVAHWENGTRKFLWTDFVECCDAFHRPLGESLKIFFHTKAQPTDYSTLCKDFLGERPLTEVASALGLSRHSLNRWLTSKNSPTFSQMMFLSYCAKPVLPDFFEQLIGPEVLECLPEGLRSQRILRDRAAEMPFLSAVYCAVALAEYRNLDEHSDEFIVRNTGLDLNSVQRALAALEEAGSLLRTKNKYTLGTYFLDLLPQKELHTRSIFQYWHRRGADIVTQPQHPRSSVFGVRVSCVSRAGLSKLRETYIRFYSEINSIIASDSEPPEVCVANTLQLLPLDGSMEEKKTATNISQN